MWVGGDAFEQEVMTAVRQKEATEMLTMPGAVFLGHTEGNEVFGKVSARLRAFAETSGYKKVVIRVIWDRHGRPIYEIYKWVKDPTAVPTPQS